MMRLPYALTVNVENVTREHSHVSVVSSGRTVTAYDATGRQLAELQDATVTFAEDGRIRLEGVDIYALGVVEWWLTVQK